MSLLRAKIQDVFNEPACEKNRGKDAKARKKGCSKPLTPGAAAGGCAFDGAKIVLQPITDAAHLIHAPLACEGNSWDNRGAASSGPTLWRTSFTTDLTELDVVMGQGERKLFKAIREIKEAYGPPAIFVYPTCVTALIGDDIEAVCKRAAEKFGLPVVPVNAPGFVGSKNLGNKIAGEALLEHVIGTVEPDDAGLYDINILGEFNLSGEFWLVKPLLDRLGIRVRACIPGDARYLDIACAHRARAAMMVCSTALINLARKMEQRWGIPFFEGSFYGISATSEALRQISQLLVKQGADPEILGRTEVLIAEEEAIAWKKLAAYRPRLAGKRVLLNTGGVKSWSVVHALMEIGIEIVGTSVKKSTVEDKDRIKQILKDDNHMFEQMAARELYAMLSEHKADIMLSGGRTQFVALKAKTPWLDINQERQHPYAGYDGMVELVRQIDFAIHNPIWGQVREPAPWDCQPAVREERPRTKSETVTLHAVQEFAGTTAADFGECRGKPMVRILPQSKAAAVNPLKSSQPLGAAFAFLGVDGAMPLFHGSQGCTSFALVLFVRHFKEAIPLQTTAMDEVATILGGADHLEQAILNLKARTKPTLIGVCTTALVETRGEDCAGDIANIRLKRTKELAGTEVVLANTPDFDGAIEEGWAKAVTAMIERITRPGEQARQSKKIVILPGWNLTVADIEHLREMVESFGLKPVILPDVSGSLDGTVPDRWVTTTYGGTSVEDIRELGTAERCIVIGEHMRRPAELLHRLTGVPYVLFRSLTGLKDADRFVSHLSAVSGAAAPAGVRRRRAQLQDALLDGHFHFGGKKIAIAAEPDQLHQLASFFIAMGSEIAAAVTTAAMSKILEEVPAQSVQIGDLGDLEALSAGADLLVTHSHGRQAAQRLGIPLMRVGFPIFDRLGAQHKLTILYQGTRDLIFEIANIFEANGHAPTPEALDPLRKREMPDALRSSPLARH